jgi:F0F1-type ATP synthase membrane subunit b/b'
LEKAREESAIERQRSLQQIDAATSAALKELADRSATLAVELAGKIVGAQLKAADHSRLIEQSVTQFARSKQVNAN